MGEFAAKQLQGQQRKASDLTRRRTPAPPGLESPVHIVQRLQRSMGNQAVLRFMRSQRAETKHGDRQANFTRETAKRGMASAPGPLPHLDAIQRSFGHHDVSRVKAHTGAQAAAANQELNSIGYTAGDHVAFAGSPDLHTAAHEAAHVVQQQNGVHLSGGVGRAGDKHERHADAVADAVVKGSSAEALLDKSHQPLRGYPARQVSRTVQMQTRPAQSAEEKKKDENKKNPTRMSLLDAKVVKGLEDCNVEFLLTQEFGAQILKDLNLPAAPGPKNKLTLLEAGALAFMLGMLRQRNEYMQEEHEREMELKSPIAQAWQRAIEATSPAAYKKARESTLIDRGKKGRSELAKTPKEDRTGKKKMLIELEKWNPDEALRDKISNIQQMDRIVELEPELQGKITTSITDRHAKPFLQKLISLGWVDISITDAKDVRMPDQFLAAVGDARQSRGIAGISGVGVGYFMYGQRGDSGRRPSKSVNIKSASGKGLEVRASAYGFDEAPENDFGTSYTRLEVVNGKGEKLADIKFNGETRKAETLSDPNVEVKISGLTVTMRVPEEYMKDGKGLMFTTKKEGAPGKDGFDEVQVHFSTTGSIVESHVPAIGTSVEEKPKEEDKISEITKEEKDKPKKLLEEEKTEQVTKSSFEFRNIYFDSDKSILKDESIRTLKALIEVLAANPKLKISIEGHTDSVGQDSYNLHLSDRRTKAAFDYLTEHGINAPRLSIKGHGEKKPIATNNTQPGRAENRRVEFKVSEY